LRQTIGNAIKYSRKNGEVSFVVNKTTDGVNLEIKDFGLGMNEAVLNSIFTLNESPYKGSMGEKGAGLSLVIVKYFVEKLNGSVKVTSEVDEGTTIKLSFS
jgi:signal transduction histidine kinase